MRDQLIYYWQGIPQTGDSVKEKVLGCRIRRSVVDQFVGVRKS